MRRIAGLMLMSMCACSHAAADPATPAPKASVVKERLEKGAATDLAMRHNELGLELWKELSQSRKGNLALSPASIGLAFGMTYAGARNATADAMRKVLRLAGIDPHPAAAELIAAWNAGGKPYALKIANQLFGDETTAFIPAFLDLMKTAYGAPLAPVDFGNDPAGARAAINAWVEGRTEGRIKDLLASPAITSATRLVLVNAIYFKGAWASKFDPRWTRAGTFHGPDGDVAAQLMRQVGTFGYGKTQDAAVLDLGYVGGELAMTIVLPHGDLASIEDGLDAARLDGWVKALRGDVEVDVTLPRFRIETEAMSLRAALTTLGMGIAFTGAADFTGMTTAVPLAISDAFHKVFVEVNEDGTEAAAATAVVVVNTSARIPPQFRADKPFLFFIRDVKSQAILFVGRVTVPT